MSIQTVFSGRSSIYDTRAKIILINKTISIISQKYILNLWIEYTYKTIQCHHSKVTTVITILVSDFWGILHRMLKVSWWFFLRLGITLSFSSILTFSHTFKCWKNLYCCVLTHIRLHLANVSLFLKVVKYC